MSSSLENIQTIAKNLWKPALLLLGTSLAASFIWGFITSGTLRLHISPTSAVVRIDGNKSNINETVDLRVSQGTHSLVISKNGFQDYVDTVVVKSGQTTALSVALQATPTLSEKSNKLKEGFGTAVRFPALALDGSALLFLSDGGSTLYKMDLTSGAKNAISDKIFPNPSAMAWSPARDRILVKVVNYKFTLSKAKSPFYSPNEPDLAITNWVYEINSKRLIKIPTEIGFASWSPQGDALYYSTVESGPNGIFKISFDGTGAKKVGEVKFNDSVVKVSPNGKYLAWYITAEGFGSNNINLVNLITGGQEELTTDGFDQGVNWSLDSSRVLVGQISASSTTALSIVDLSTRSKKLMSVKASPEAAVWSSDSLELYVYSLSGRALVKIDTISGHVTELTKVATGVPANLILTSDGSALYYTLDDSLYSLSLR